MVYDTSVQTNNSRFLLKRTSRRPPPMGKHNGPSPRPQHSVFNAKEPKIQ